VGDDGGRGTDGPDGVASRQVVGTSDSVIFPCTIESRRWRAVVEEVDKGCSEFCTTVGTVTRTAGSYCCMMGLFCVHRLLVACPQYLYTKKVK